MRALGLPGRDVQACFARLAQDAVHEGAELLGLLHRAPAQRHALAQVVTHVVVEAAQTRRPGIDALLYPRQPSFQLLVDHGPITCLRCAGGRPS